MKKRKKKGSKYKQKDNTQKYNKHNGECPCCERGARDLRVGTNHQILF